MSSQPHWERVYQTKSVSQLSWHRAHLDISLRLIQGATDNDQARIIDVGAGNRHWSTIYSLVATRISPYSIYHKQPCVLRNSASVNRAER